MTPGRPRAPPDQQVRDRRQHEHHDRVVDVLEVVAPAAPVAADLAPSTPRPPIQMIEPASAARKKRTNGISATPAAYGNAARANGIIRDTKIAGAAVAFGPAVGAVELLRVDVELAALALQQLAAPVVADRVGDRRPGHVSHDARHDDPGQRQIAVVDVKAGEQHHRLGARHADHAGGRGQHRHARVAKAVDHIRGQVDQRPGQGCKSTASMRQERSGHRAADEVASLLGFAAAHGDPTVRHRDAAGAAARESTNGSAR